MSQTQQQFKTGRFSTAETRLLISKYEFHDYDVDKVIADEDVKALGRSDKCLRSKISYLKKKASSISRGTYR
jgi:hypothetical protein